MADSISPRSEDLPALQRALTSPLPSGQLAWLKLSPTPPVGGAVGVGCGTVVGGVDDDGALFIVGRLRELIICSGFNVYPAEIEGVLNAHPAVMHSAVVGRVAADNEEVVAFVELAPNQHATPDELAQFAATRLSPYKRPAEIVVLPALPASATGKILKIRLRELAQRVA